MMFPSPVSFESPRARRLLRSRVGRALAPHWGALLALALFLIVGLAVLDDYGVARDEAAQRLIAEYNLGYITRADASIAEFGYIDASDVFYGPAFELPLLLVERTLGLQDSRGIYLARHQITQLFFLAGGLFAYLLAMWLFRNHTLALFAMALFLLHPRLYADSFFNSKDIPFLVGFIIALFLAHRAFKRDTLLAFALLGVGVGVLVNIRIMGVIMLAAIPVLRTFDFAFAAGWAERKRILLTTGAFALTAALMIYVLLPYLWADPLGRAVEWWTTLSDHPNILYELFRGALYGSDEFSADYVPTWFAITSPPFALLLGLVGAGSVLLSAVRAPQAVVRRGRLRFRLLLVGCIAVPVVAVILLDSNIYNGWRQLYFIWAPFSLLAVAGLRWLAAAFPRARLRAAVYGAAGAGLAVTLLSMALIHPNQQTFFNFSVDRVAPEYLRTQYVMDYWGHSSRQAFEWLSNNADLLPDKAAITGDSNWEDDINARILPDSTRARIAEHPGFSVIGFAGWGSSRSARALHRVQVYDNTILTVERKDDLQAAYKSTRGREPDVAGAYDVRRLDGAVALVMEPCAPLFIEQVGATLRATPVDLGDLPPWRKGKQEALRHFPLREYGAFFDGKCVASLPLPGYPIADFSLVWSPELLERESAREAMRRAKEEGRLLARSVYDVHLANGELVYIREQCDPLETEHPFRMSVFSERAEGSSERRRRWDRETTNFEFRRQGALLEDGACVARFPLPDYPIAGIRTAQYAEDGGDLWSAAFSTNPEPYVATYRAAAGSEPLARGAFDLHLLDGDLVYVKEPCEQADTDARFFLHAVPERVGDLPEDRREHGFDNLDFRFFLNGAWFDGKCAARVPLPPYPIASVRTGQFSGDGEIWSADFAVVQPSPPDPLPPSGEG